MNKDIYFVNIMIVVVFIFILWQGIQIIFMTNRTKETQATVIETRFVNPSGIKFRNSNWAFVSYKVGSNTILSKNTIQVPMNVKVGEKIQVRYYKNSPERIATFSISKLIKGILIAALFILVRLCL